MNIKRIGLDLAKQVFQLHAVDHCERVVLRKTLRRTQMLTFSTRLEPCLLIGIEACGSSHYWARELTRLGHSVRIIPPQFVKPYLKAIKMMPMMPKRSARPSAGQGCAMLPLNLKHSRACRLSTGFVPA